MIDLKSCPFCGGSPTLRISGREDPRCDDSYIRIACTNCVVLMVTRPANAEKLREVVDKWNGRV